MKKRNGYTLIELMAIVIIIGTIAALSFAALGNTIKKNKDREMKTFENNIIVATKLYLTANEDKYRDLNNIGGRVNISTTDLIESGYLKSTIGNPTDIPLNKYFVIVKVNEESYYDYYVVSDENKKNEELIYNDDILNGADPRLISDMMPIKFDSNGYTVKSSIYDEWYNYTKKEWANVIILKKNAKNKYDNSPIGTLINPSDIQAYLVWIPRFKYEIFNNYDNYSNIKKEIDLEFENNKTIKSKGTSKGKYLTAPGFTFGNVELNGLWVGKFETSIDESYPAIVANKTASMGKNLSELWKEALTFNELLDNGDAHISKLSEYATLQFLASSEYGQQDIKSNSNNEYKTGCGSISNTEVDECINKFGEASSIYTQSTTGNQYGVFDVSGGAWEFTMAFKGTKDKKPYVGYDTAIKTGFQGLLLNKENSTGIKMPEKRYYNLLPALSWKDLCKNDNFYGYAICETAAWNDNMFSYDGDEGGVTFEVTGSSIQANSGIYALWGGTGLVENDSYRISLCVN